MDPVLPAIEATEEKAIRPLKVVDRNPVEHWGSGRATLLGDAAHPMTWDLGQGAGQAIEDALVLSRCLAENADVEAGLRAYERRRLPRTALLAFQSRRIGRAASWEHPVLCSLRDSMFRLSWDRGLRRLAENVIMGYRA
jgi:2-polyprenyl-6-methoxyphenol hydroxylase-like FAD-dependent oxidoreductase